MGLVRFDEETEHLVSEGYSQGRGTVLRSTLFELTKIRFAKGERAEAHAHGEEQAMYVISGKLLITLGDESYEVGPGEATFNPSFITHAAEALEDTVALSFKTPLVSDVYTFHWLAVLNVVSPMTAPRISARAGFPASVERGSFRFFSGLAAASSEPMPSSASWIELAELEWATQSDAVYTTLDTLAADAGGMAAIMRLHLFQQDKRFFPVLEGVRLAREGAMPAPSSGIGVERLHSDPRVVIEADGIALSASGRDRYGSREAVLSGSAGKSASHYSQFSTAGPYSFLAGMIGLDPDTGRLIAGYEDVPEQGRLLQRGRSHPDARTGPVAAQTWFLYQRILGVAAELGAGEVCQSTVFLSEPGDAADFLRMHQAIFNDSGPALHLTCVDEVGHKGTVIEIECTVAVGLSVRRTESLLPGQEAPDVVVAGELAFVSDRLGLGSDGPRTNTTPGLDGIRRDAEAGEDELVAQSHHACTSLLNTLERANIPIESLGHLWARVRRPHDASVVAEVLREVLGSSAYAVTISEVAAIPQSARALVSVSAVCGGLA